MEPLRFDLTDGDGATHSYEVLPHDTDAGLVIVGKLMQAGAPSLVTAIKAFLGSGIPIGSLAALAGPATTPAEKESKRKALLALIGGVDLSAMLANVEGIGDKLAAAIPQLDIARLGPELMRRTSRTNADGVLVKLDSPVEFNKAFKANYWELIAACQKVIAFNRFLPRLGS